ncbi:MAG TPA: allophanate hydrolase [Caulobacteraceae bacterium]|nr:allophanate hydrolase [Caulobacteraceae bacterium]
MDEALDTSALAGAVRTGKATAAGLAAEALARADAYDGVQPQAWIMRLTADAVLARAREADARAAAGEDLPLAGVPFAVKDNIDLAGVPTTVACPAFAYQPAADAAVIERLSRAGAVPIGKTNMDQFATGLTGSRSPYGACGCVFNRAYISGGSSSGSAVAVAAGLVPFALGTDTAGSGRAPAAFNGLVGFKPTRGRWSTRGVVPACRSLDCVSVLARSAADAALIDQVLAGFDPADPYARAAPADAPAAGALRLALPGRLDWMSDRQSEALFERAVAAARGLCAEVVEVDLEPFVECARLLYQGPWVAERAAALGPILRERPAALHPVIRAIVTAAAHVTAAEAFEGFYRLKTYERSAQALWARADILLLPTTPTTFRIAEVLAEPFGLNAALGTYTNFVNLLDMAAVSVPAGFHDSGAGFGVSLIGPAWSDRTLLGLAGRLMAALPVERPPIDLAQREARVTLAVVGAHLNGLPLHWQLTSRHARFLGAARTVPAYRLYAMAGGPPQRPALVFDADGGAAIEVELYELDLAAFGSFTAEVAPPLAIGAVTLADGAEVRGFVAEPRALAGAREITGFGGWRAFLHREAGKGDHEAES